MEDTNSDKKRKIPINGKVTKRVMNIRVAKARSIEKPKSKRLLINKRYKEIREVLKDGKRLDRKQEEIFLALLDSGKFFCCCTISLVATKFYYNAVNFNFLANLKETKKSRLTRLRAAVDSNGGIYFLTK